MDLSSLPPRIMGMGLLGSTVEVPAGMSGLSFMQEARLEMIERRILRLEMVLRRNGIEPESLELPK